MSTRKPNNPDSCPELAEAAVFAELALDALGQFRTGIGVVRLACGHGVSTSLGWAGTGASLPGPSGEAGPLTGRLRWLVVLAGPGGSRPGQWTIDRVPSIPYSTVLSSTKLGGLVGN